MTKIRQPLTAAYAVQRAIEAVPLPILAEAVGKSPGLVYKWSDPDEPNEISVSAALMIDQVVSGLHAEPPFLALFERNAQDADAPAVPVNLRESILQMTAAMGSLSAAVLEATQPHSEGGEKLSANERANMLALIEGFRCQLEEAERAIIPRGHAVAA